MEEGEHMQRVISESERVCELEETEKKGYYDGRVNSTLVWTLRDSKKKLESDKREREVERTEIKGAREYE